MTAADAAPRATRTAVGLLTVVLVISCTADPRTEILLVVDAEPDVRAMATHLELRVLGASADADDWREVRAQTLGSPVEWPRSLGLVPRDGEQHRRFDVRAVARQGVDGPVVAQARVLSSYVPEQTRELRLTLEDACIGRSCAETETCRAGMCMPPQPIDPQSLVRLDGHPASTSGCPEDMLRVPAQGATVTFVMGSPEGVGEDNERPETEVALDAYCLDRTEVTVLPYLLCMGFEQCAPTAGDCPFELADDHPMTCVEWAQAAAYCAFIGRRLPTEAEWEHAARGVERRTYPWGEGPPAHDRLNACGTECEATSPIGDDGYPETAPVGSFPAGAGPYGHLDLAGNVWEWVDDFYAPYPGGSRTNPRVGTDTGLHVVRGAGWGAIPASWMRGAYRLRADMSFRDHSTGFRCASDAP